MTARTNHGDFAAGDVVGVDGAFIGSVPSNEAEIAARELILSAGYDDFF